MKKYITLLFWLTITGNALYILWIVYNGIESGFKGSLVSIVSYLGLITLLLVNISLLILSRRKDL